YNAKDFDKTIVLPQRTKLVAKIISDYLKNTNRRFDKSIFFCVDIEHAERMRKELINENLDLVEKDERYVMRITGDDEIGKNQLDNFINPRKKYPTLVTTSKLLTTGIDAKTCKLIVLDTNINSMIEFKQIIGRGTRIAEDFNKATFTIIDFRNVTKLFQDPEFDGDPIEVKEEGTVTKDKAKQPKIEVNPEDIMEPKKKEKRYKFYLPNESVYEIYRHERLIDEKGNLITESFMQYVKNKITKEFETHTLFTQYWNSSEIKETVIKAMEEKDIYFNILEEMVGEEYDPFDLIMHVAYDKPALTRSQRARKVKQSEYFEKYGEQAKEVIKLLLTKYVDKGIRELENPEILNVPEFKGFGSMLEIINNVFKGIKNYKDMINHLKKELYQ
ncbi:MAG: type I restriction-modification enzyme R subunit C-terminal domain-containing protein, partial [Bacilli bacterium]